jgi:hypothetical protein
MRRIGRSKHTVIGGVRPRHWMVEIEKKERSRWKNGGRRERLCWPLGPYVRVETARKVCLVRVQYYFHFPLQLAVPLRTTAWTVCSS